jgi:hypothetical protein
MERPNGAESANIYPQRILALRELCEIFLSSNIGRNEVGAIRIYRISIPEDAQLPESLNPNSEIQVEVNRANIEHNRRVRNQPTSIDFCSECYVRPGEDSSIILTMVNKRVDRGYKAVEVSCRDDEEAAELMFVKYPKHEDKCLQVI